MEVPIVGIGDHLQALCRRIARTRLRGAGTGRTEGRRRGEDAERAISTPELTAEGGSSRRTSRGAVYALFSTFRPSTRISIRGDLAGHPRLRAVRGPGTPVRDDAEVSCSAITVLMGGRGAGHSSSTTSRSARGARPRARDAHRPRARRGLSAWAGRVVCGASLARLLRRVAARRGEAVHVIPRPATPGADHPPASNGPSLTALRDMLLERRSSIAPRSPDLVPSNRQSPYPATR